MVLYVCIVLLAEIGALPSGSASGGASAGPVGWELAALIWGTTIGLVLAHAFAFKVVRRDFGDGRMRSEERSELRAELVGAALVAAVSSAPVLLLSEGAQQKTALYALVLLIGVVGYLVERANGRTRVRSFAFGVAALAVGMIVAIAKTLLGYH